MESNDVRDLFLKRKDPLLKWLCAFYPLSDELIEKYRNEIDWHSLSSNEEVKWTENFIAQYQDRLSFNVLARNKSLPWSKELIDRYPKFWETKEALSGNQNLPWSEQFIADYSDRWNWHYLTVNKGINWTQDMFTRFQLFDENLSSMNGSDLWTSEFLLTYAERLNWSRLTYNWQIDWTIELIDSVKHFWKKHEQSQNDFIVTPWSGLSQNASLNWSKDLLERYMTKPLIRRYGWKWKDLSRNIGLPFQMGIIEEYESKWDWTILSYNNGTRFTMEQIEKYHDRFVWNTGKPQSLSRNTHLPWGEELLDKYIDEWDWWQLGYNEGIEWSSNLLEKYKDYILPQTIFCNKNLPWNINFLMKNEDQVFSSWRFIEPQKAKWFFDKIFMPLLNDRFVDEVFFKLTNPFDLIKQSSTSDEFVQLSKRLLESIKVDDPNYMREGDKKMLLDKIQSGIALIALHDGIGDINVHSFLESYIDFEDNYFNKHVVELLDLFIHEIEDFFGERGDLEYMVNVVHQHNSDVQQYEAFRAQGGHVSIDFSYLHQCHQQKGVKALGLARLLLGMVKLRNQIDA